MSRRRIRDKLGFVCVCGYSVRAAGEYASAADHHLPGARGAADNVFTTYNLGPGELRQIGAGTNVYASLLTVFWGDHNNPTVVNHGRIWNISPTNVGTAINGFNMLEVRDHGLIVSEAPAGNAYGIAVGSRGAVVVNTGEILRNRFGRRHRSRALGPVGQSRE